MPMASTTSLMTAEEAEHLPSDLRWELIDGVLIEMPPVNASHGGIAVTIALVVGQYIRAHRLGRLYVEVGFILRRNPDTVRAPDLAFVRADRLPPGGEPRGFWEIAPDLAVEIVSPSNTPAEVQVKIREWIEAGTREVWVVYPE